MQEYVIATACDKNRWPYAMNLLGSLATNSPGAKKIYIYDLGMTWVQRLQICGMRGVKLKKVQHFTKYWRQGYSWKPWIWMNIPDSKVLFLDAGTEVLRDLTEICDLVDRDGYFLVSQYETLDGGCTLGRITPADYFKQFSLASKHKKDPVVAAGIIGYQTSSLLYTKVMPETYKAVLEGYNLGWSKNETWRNFGINKLPSPAIRDCEYFRHDQTLLNLFLYKEIPKPVTQEITKFGGFNSPHDNPEQLIWNSRGHSNLDHFNHIDYGFGSSFRKNINKLYYRWRVSKLGSIYDRLIDKLKRTIGLIY